MLKLGRTQRFVDPMAGQPQHADRLRAGCLGAGFVRPSASGPGLDAPFRQGQSPLHRTLESGGHTALGGQQGRQLRNALAETINGLYKTELIHRQAPWKSREPLELATLQRIHWFNHVLLLKPIGSIPPAEAEANYWRQLAGSDT